MAVTTLERNVALVINGSAERILYCSCGEVKKKPGFLFSDDGFGACPACNAKIEHKADRKPTAKKIKLATKLKAISKDNQHFHLQKSTDYILLDLDGEGKKITPKSGRVMEIKFDFRSKLLTMIKGKSVIVADYDAEAFSSFSRGLSQEEIVACASTPDTSFLFTFILNSFGKEYGEMSNIFFRGLVRYLRRDRHNIGEKLAAAGFGKFIQSIYSNGSYSFFDMETLPAILGVEKRHLPYVKQVSYFEGRHQMRAFSEADEILSWNNMKAFYDYGLDYNDMYDLLSNAKTYATLCKDYGYNPKRLAEYLNREVRLLQGIDGLRTATTLLYDYNRFMRDLGLDVDKYPRSLKKEHDLAAMNLAAIQLETNGEGFTVAVEKDAYKDLAYVGETYAIVIPKEPKDLSDEGTYLTHCVAGYIKDVVNEKCKIVFLRNKQALNISLVTVEVRGENIIQASGFDNRKLVAKEREFVKEWAEVKRLKSIF